MSSLKLPRARVHLLDAPAWRRILAFLADLLVIDVIIVGPFERFYQDIKMGSIAESLAAIPPQAVAATVAIGFLALLYFMLMEHVLGSTVGMSVFGLAVAGDRTFWQCLVRNLYALPFFPFTLFWIIDPVLLFWRKERLLERWSSTSTVLVVQESPYY
jgi:hypothetical protein